MKKSRTVMQVPMQVEEEDVEPMVNSNTRSTSYAESSTRPRRQAVRPSRFLEYEMYSDAGVDEEGDIIHLALMAGSEPLNSDDALSQPLWREAMMEELRSTKKNKTRKLVDLPPEKQCIGAKWVFKTKLNPDGTVSKHNARLVARGFLQQQGVYFKEVYALVARLETIRLVIVIACAKKWPLFSLDVKFAFLHGPLEEEVYVQQPPRFNKEKEHQMYKLHKALYGLRQAPSAWNKRIDAFFSGNGFERCTVEHNLYVKKIDNNDLLIFCFYVDDLLVTGSSLDGIEEFKQMMKVEFEMADLGRLNYFFGMEFTHTTAGLMMHQKKYVKDLLERFKMTQCKAIRNPVEVNVKLRLDEDEKSMDETTHKQLVGSLRFLCNSRPDLMYGFGLLSIFMSNPRKIHLIVAKHVLRYVKGTTEYGHKVLSIDVLAMTHPNMDFSYLTERSHLPGRPSLFDLRNVFVTPSVRRSEQKGMKT
ncbi:hypothetical protein V8G54_026855 [Vigna mungo]|uniref:Reverse transcriptase Ty1/copia-type domain-containing protein n=1 Tax=Vigna mungo TaxID=3915 RepID=A0AAQ3N1S9_VIGMU